LARPALQRLIDEATPGSTVTVYKLDRLARNLRDLLSVLDMFTDRGVHFRCLDPAIDTGDTFGRFMLQFLGAIAELERGMISDRTKSALAKAKANGVRLGPPLKVTDERRGRILEALTSGQPVILIANTHNVSRATVYRIKREYGVS